MTGISVFRWARAASSGTTPPNGAWISSCDRMMFESARGPLSTTAAAVSSQEVSIARYLRADPFDLERFEDLLETLLEAGCLD
jgi:hypothetical protein